jgi:hypothetical protein
VLPGRSNPLFSNLLIHFKWDTYNHLFLSILQDGTIDYNEFVAMMRKGNAAGVGKKGLENGFSIGFREALRL